MCTLIFLWHGCFLSSLEWNEPHVWFPYLLTLYLPSWTNKRGLLVRLFGVCLNRLSLWSVCYLVIRCCLLSYLTSFCSLERPFELYIVSRHFNFALSGIIGKFCVFLYTYADAEVDYLISKFVSDCVFTVNLNIIINLAFSMESSVVAKSSKNRWYFLWYFNH